MTCNSSDTMESPKTHTTLGEYLIDQSISLNVHHIFGIPGDYVLGFYNQLDKKQKSSASPPAMNKAQELQLMLMQELEDWEQFVLLIVSVDSR